MEEQTKRYLNPTSAARLAKATIDQLNYRLGLKETDTHVFDYNRFQDFFLSLTTPEESSGGLVLSGHKKLYDLPRDFMQHYEVRNPAPIADLEVYPRGVIVSSGIEGDITRYKDKTVLERVKAEIARANKRFGPRFTKGKHGRHSFSSEIAYAKMLRNEDIRAVLRTTIARQEPYLGFMRVDYHSLKPKVNTPGWFTPKQVDWIKSFPVIIIPGISQEQLEVMVNKETELLGFKS